MSATWILAKCKIGWGEIKYYTVIPGCPRGNGSRIPPPYQGQTLKSFSPWVLHPQIQPAVDFYDCGCLIPQMQNLRMQRTDHVFSWLLLSHQNELVCRPWASQESLSECEWVRCSFGSVLICRSKSFTQGSALTCVNRRLSAVTLTVTTHHTQRWLQCTWHFCEN